MRVGIMVLVLYSAWSLQKIVYILFPDAVIYTNAALQNQLCVL